MKKNSDALVVYTNLIGLDVNADENQNMVLSRDQNAGRSHSIKIYIFFVRVEEFRYFGTILTNQNFIQEEIKSRLKSGNPCYHSVQNILSSSLLIQKCNDSDIRKCNFSCCIIWMRYLVAHIAGGT